MKRLRNGLAWGTAGGVVLAVLGQAVRPLLPGLLLAYALTLIIAGMFGWLSGR